MPATGGPAEGAGLSVCEAAAGQRAGQADAEGWDTRHTAVRGRSGDGRRVHRSDRHGRRDV